MKFYLCVHNSSELQNLFSRSAFSRSAFSRSLFSRSLFSRSAFSRSAFLRSAVCGLCFRGLCFRDTPICSPNISVGRIKILTLSRFKHFLMLCRTRDMKSQNFLSRNRQKNRLLLLSHKSTRVACLCKNERDVIRSQNPVLFGASKIISCPIRA